MDYFGLGQIEYLRTTILWVVLKEPYWCAIIAFALNTGAYTSEILRSAFQTIKPGFIEAGKSLGISNKVIFYKKFFYSCILILFAAIIIYSNSTLKENFRIKFI